MPNLLSIKLLITGVADSDSLSAEKKLPGTLDEYYPNIFDIKFFIVDFPLQAYPIKINIFYFYLPLPEKATDINFNMYSNYSYIG